MQTANVVIFSVRPLNSTEKETAGGSNALYQKYFLRGKSKLDWTWIARDGSLETVEHAGIDLKANRQVGAYVIAHSGDFDHCRKQIAKAIKDYLDAKNEPYELEKVCLLVCAGASGTNNGTPQSVIPKVPVENDDGYSSLLQVFAQGLIAVGLHPKIAGWNNIITVCYEGSGYTGKFDQKENVGRKIGPGPSGGYVLFKDRPSKKRAEHKFVYVYDMQQGYVLKTLADWTDKK